MRCNPIVTISGLTEAVEANLTDFAINYVGVSQNISKPFSLDSFDRAAGIVKLRVHNSTMAGITYRITFKLRHRAQISSGVDTVLSMEHTASNSNVHQSQETNLAPSKVFGYKFETSSVGLDPGSGDAQPMKVKPLAYVVYAGQSSFHPCDTNTIWYVSLIFFL